MEVYWDRLDARAWAAALPPDACALQQHWRYGAAVQAMGREVRRAELWDGGRFYGLAQMPLRQAGALRVGLISRGPVWMDRPADLAASLAAIRRSFARTGLPVLLATPETGRAGLPLMTPACMAELALASEPAEMRARMKGKWRNRLVRAEQAGLRVSVTVPAAGDLDRLCALDGARGRARGYRGLPRAFLGAWAGTKGPPMRLFTARADGGAIAEMLFLDHAPGATYQIGWSDDAGRAAGAHHLLLWRAMRHFARAGRRRLDLGMLDTEAAPGLARFKLGTGAVPRWLGATGLILPGAGRAAGRRRGAGTSGGSAQALSFSRSLSGSAAGSTGGTFPPG